MSLLHVDLHLTVILDAPLHIGIGYGHAGFLDAVMTTDAEGLPYIPGSSLKGRLRYYLTKIQPTLAPTDRATATLLFGSKEQAGALVFENCALTTAWADLVKKSLQSDLRPVLARTQAPVVSQRQSNVMLSRLRGVALERRLFSIENAPAHLAFAGRIFGQIDSNLSQGYPQSLSLLVAAIRSCTHLGGRKSRGLGRCEIQIDQLYLDNKETDSLKLLEALA